MFMYNYGGIIHVRVSSQSFGIGKRRQHPTSCWMEILMWLLCLMLTWYLANNIYTPGNWIPLSLKLIDAREAHTAFTTLYPHPSFSFRAGQASAGTSLNRGAGGLESGIPRALHQMERMAPDPSRYHHAENTSATVTARGGAAAAAVTVAGPVRRE